MRTKVLLLNREGQPMDWISQEEAIHYHATEKVIFQVGREDQFIFRGGFNRAKNAISTLATAPIIAVDGASDDRTYKVPTISNRILFQRDEHRCGYCGRKFSQQQLTRDHIIPRSRGGLDRWENVISCCKYHNNIKDDMTPEEFGMKLLFTPYVPTFAEVLYLREPIASLPIQTEYLLDFFPAESRIRNRATEWI